MSEIVPLLKFTPSAQDPEVLEAITVQRESLIAKLVEVALDPGGGARHQLLIGPRGIGKTHILSLVASRVRDEDADSVTLAWLDEDPWGVSSYEKFLAAIIGRIAAERADAELEAKANELHATRDEEGRQAEQVLRDAVGESRLVLLVENLDEIFRRIGPNGQERFRAMIEDWQQMLVIATAPQLFEGVQLHESPFYGFFAITHLEELSLESAGELMRRVAELRKDQALVRFLATEVARRRLAAVEALAGGHPRIWLLLSGCVSIYAIDELVPLFLEALDDLTPYYQDRLRELGDQQQELVVLLGEAGGALSNRELSERSGIAQNQVATILRQLTDRGYVRRAEVPDELAKGDARMSYWELREPLMRLCMDVKQARGKPLRMVVEFLRAWYGPRLLDELASLPPTAQLASTYVSEALRTLQETVPADDLFRGSPGEVLARAEAGLSVDPQRWEFQTAKISGLLMDSRYGEARDAIEEMLQQADSEQGRLVLEAQLIGVQRELGEPADSAAHARKLLALTKSQPHTGALFDFVATGLSLIGHHEEALKIFPLALDLGAENGVLLWSYGRSLSLTGRYEEGIEAFGRALAFDDMSRVAIYVDRGSLLRLIGRSQDALKDFTAGVELDPAHAECHRLQGVTLGEMGRHGEALEAIDRGLEIDPMDPRLYGYKGASLFELERHQEALEAFTRASELDPENALRLELRALLLCELRRLEEALPFFRRVSELEPDNAHSLSRQAVILCAFGRLEEAERLARRAIELEGEEPTFQFILSEITFAKGEYEDALVQMREALSLWSKEREALPGESDVLCRVLWDRGDATMPRSEAIAQIAEAYGEMDAAESLGPGLVASISWIADSEVDIESAEAWVADWTKAEEIEDLQIPMRLLRTAVAWKKDRDRSHLLALPHEQREILVDLLESAGSGVKPESDSL